MASSRSSVDDDSFRERVKKTFGSLSFSPSQSYIPSHSSTPSNPLWSLTDDEIEKREWRREHDSRARDSNPCSSSLDELFSRNRSRRSLGSLGNDLDDAPEEEGNRSGADEWQIRSSIGLDNTLDDEEEEDIDDILASGRDNAGDRLYMRDVKESTLPKSDNRSRAASVLAITRKDPRANRLAAITRLKEDDAAVAATPTGEKSNDTERPTSYTSAALVKETDNTGASTTSNVVKPILKRKGVDKDSSSKAAKRVRFDPGCKVNECLSISNMVDEAPSGGVGTTTTTTTENGLFVSNEKKTTNMPVPDYLLNPSKYKCYSLDSTCPIEDDKASSSDSDLCSILVKSSTREVGLGNESAHADALRSVVFIPKKRSNAAAASELVNPDGGGETTPSTKDVNEVDSSVTRISDCSLRGLLEEQEDTAIGMEIDEAEAEEIGVDKLTSNLKKPGRRYRSRSTLDE